MRTYRQPQPPDTDDFDEEYEYVPPIPTQRRSRLQEPPQQVLITRTASRSMSRSPVFLLLGAGIVLSVVLAFQHFVLPAWDWSQDQWHYGDARITQLEADVGHGGTSHFIASYYKGRVVVIEILLDHPADNRMYTVTGFTGNAGSPIVLLSVRDANNDGKADLIIHVEGTVFEIVLYNSGNRFSTNGR